MKRRNFSKFRDRNKQPISLKILTLFHLQISNLHIRVWSKVADTLAADLFARNVFHQYVHARGFPSGA